MTSLFKYKHLFMLAIVLIPIVSFSQSTKKADRFSYVVSKVTGDLNKDNLPDYAVVTQDTLADTSPYHLQVFFAKPGGGYELKISSTKAINEQYAGGKNGYREGYSFTELKIKNGVLIINCSLIRGNFNHKFRYQNGNFELIGYTTGYSDGHSQMVDIDFNLSTGVHLEKVESFETGEVASNKKKIIKIRPLPKLQDFVPYKSDYY